MKMFCQLKRAAACTLAAVMLMSMLTACGGGGGGSDGSAGTGGSNGSGSSGTGESSAAVVTPTKTTVGDTNTNIYKYFSKYGSAFAFKGTLDSQEWYLKYDGNYNYYEKCGNEGYERIITDRSTSYQSEKESASAEWGKYTRLYASNDAKTSSQQLAYNILMNTLKLELRPDINSSYEVTVTKNGIYTIETVDFLNTAYAFVDGDLKYIEITSKNGTQRLSNVSYETLAAGEVETEFNAASAEAN